MLSQGPALVVPRDNFCPEGRRVSSKSPEGQKLSRGTTSSSERKKNSKDFPEGQHQFAEGENKLTTKNFHPSFPHPSMISWQNRTPVSIFPSLIIYRHSFKFYFIASYASKNHLIIVSFVKKRLTKGKTMLL